MYIYCIKFACKCQGVLIASFKSCIKNRQPQTAIRYSRCGYVTDGSITNLPLYLAPITNKLI
ncbi:MAG TPA: hypothetical protein DD727_06455 [Clostridiales bacterium]|nr:hypothetical protein [Clostridiales bacterium]